MPQDADLADRLRVLLAAEPGLHEKKLFGGIAFLLNGHMAVCASGQGGLMVGVDPADQDSLQRWVDRGTACARALPPKTGQTRSSS